MGRLDRLVARPDQAKAATAASAASERWTGESALMGKGQPGKARKKKKEKAKKQAANKAAGKK